MFLTDDDIHRLTGKKRPSAQIEILRQRRIPFEVDAHGHPVIMERALLEHMLGYAAKPDSPSTEPDFSNVA